MLISSERKTSRHCTICAPLAGRDEPTSLKPSPRPAQNGPLILPCLYSELEKPEADAPHFLDELSKVTYLHRIIIGLTAPTRPQFRHAKRVF